MRTKEHYSVQNEMRELMGKPDHPGTPNFVGDYRDSLWLARSSSCELPHSASTRLMLVLSHLEIWDAPSCHY